MQEFKFPILLISRAVPHSPVAGFPPLLPRRRSRGSEKVAEQQPELGEQLRQSGRSPDWAAASTGVKPWADARQTFVLCVVPPVPWPSPCCGSSASWRPRRPADCSLPNLLIRLSAARPAAPQWGSCLARMGLWWGWPRARGANPSSSSCRYKPTPNPEQGVQKSRRQANGAQQYKPLCAGWWPQWWLEKRGKSFSDGNHQKLLRKVIGGFESRLRFILGGRQHLGFWVLRWPPEHQSTAVSCCATGLGGATC